MNHRSHFTKPIVYIDMDGTLVDFEGFFSAPIDFTTTEPDLHPTVFQDALPMQGAIESVHLLAEHYELFILSTSPWDNPLAASQKIAWIKKHFGDQPDSVFYKKVILSHKKFLNTGDYLIDDRLHPGFSGEHLHFGIGSDGTPHAFPDWISVREYLLNKLANS